MGRTMIKPTIFLLATTSTFALAGCQEYLTRSDRVSPYAGDAVARNAANQTIDPWPIYVYDNNIRTSSERQAVAIRKYKAGPKDETAPNSSPAVAVPALAPADPSN